MEDLASEWEELCKASSNFVIFWYTAQMMGISDVEKKEYTWCMDIFLDKMKEFGATCINGDHMCAWPLNGIQARHPLVGWHRQPQRERVFESQSNIQNMMVCSAKWDSDVLNRLRRILHGKKHEFTRLLLLKPSSCRTV